MSYRLSYRLVGTAPNITPIVIRRTLLLSIYRSLLFLSFYLFIFFNFEFLFFFKYGLFSSLARIRTAALVTTQVTPNKVAVTPREAATIKEAATARLQLPPPMTTLPTAASPPDTRHSRSLRRTTNTEVVS